MSLMALGLEQGEAVAVRVSGPAEESTCRQLVALFETRFDFPPRG
jgi:phosphotransferase system HPr-like phosphotransfer protein